MTPQNTKSPWKDNRPPLKSDSDAFDIGSPEGLHRIRGVVAAAIANGSVRMPRAQTEAPATTSRSIIKAPAKAATPRRADIGPHESPAAHTAHQGGAIRNLFRL